MFFWTVRTVCVCVFNILLQHHGEAVQAARVQAQPPAHQALVEGAERAEVLGDGLDQTQPLHVDHLSSSQEEADPFFQPVRLLLEAAVARQLLKQLETQEEDGSEAGLRRHLEEERRTAAALLWPIGDEHPYSPAGRVQSRSSPTGQQTQPCVLEGGTSVCVRDDALLLPI